MKKYLQVAKITIINTFEYRMDVISSFLMYILGVGTSFFIWQKLMKDYSQIGNYNLNSIMTYFLLKGAFLGIFNHRTTKKFEMWIRSGILSTHLIKPIKVFIYFFFRESGGRIVVMLIGGIVSFIPVILIPQLRETLYLNHISIIWFLIFYILSSIFLFLFHSTLGCIAFWTVSTGGLRNITMNLLRILKGNWFPLDLAPMWFQNILSILPFQYSLFYPIKILTGYTPIESHIKGILVLVFSIILLIVIIRLQWSKGIKRYDSVGT